MDRPANEQFRLNMETVARFSGFEEEEEPKKCTDCGHNPCRCDWRWDE